MASVDLGEEAWARLQALASVDLGEEAWARRPGQGFGIKGEEAWAQLRQGRGGLGKWAFEAPREKLLERSSCSREAPLIGHSRSSLSGSSSDRASEKLALGKLALLIDRAFEKRARALEPAVG